MKHHTFSFTLGVMLAIASGGTAADEKCLSSVTQSEFVESRVYGSLDPASVSQVAAKRAGHVAAWHVEVGDHVTKGDELMSLEVTDEIYALKHASQARRLAERQLASSQQLLADKHVSAIEVEEMKATLAQRVMEEEKAALAVENRTLKAPFNGIVEKQMVEIGEYVSLGQEALRLIERDRHRISADLYQAPSRCADVDACVIYYDVGNGRQGPYGLDFMVPLTEQQHGMFRLGAYLDGDMTSGLPATLYILPKSLCEES